MTKQKLLIPVFLVLLAAGLFAATAVADPVAEHDETGHGADCFGVTGEFGSFPQGTQTITVTGVTSIDKTFEGPSGSISALWSELGVDPSDGLVHTYSFSWTADGGGSAGPFTFDAVDCAPDEPPPCDQTDDCEPPCDGTDCEPPPPPCEEDCEPPPTTVPPVVPPTEPPGLIPPASVVPPTQPAQPVTGSPSYTG